MSGRNEFTEAEIERRSAANSASSGALIPTIKRQFEAACGESGFYITDYSHDADGFTVPDLDETVRRGTIRQRS